MRSVADEVRERDRQAVQRLSAQERVELAFHLGDLDLEAFCASHGLDRASGLRRLRQQRQRGRSRSACMSLATD
jgi:hypothetical protein